MHGSDSHHTGGDHSYGAAGGHGYGSGHNEHIAGGGDHHGAQGSHDFSIAHAGETLGHAGFAVDAVIFMGIINFLEGHNPGFHYSMSHNTVNVHYDNHYRVDGTGKGLGLRRKVVGNPDKPLPPVEAIKMNPDTNIFVVHAHNIGVPDLDILFSIWPERYGFVDITDYPGNAGVREPKNGTPKMGKANGWDWFHPDEGPLPPGALPGVEVGNKRNKRVFQLGAINPALPCWRRWAIYWGLGHAPRKGELVPNVHQNCVVESYDQEWDYDATGTAEAKIEARVKGNKRFYQGMAPVYNWLFSRRGILPHWSLVWDPYEAHRAATLALMRRMHHELSEFKRVPGKLEAYIDMLKRLPDGGRYNPPPEIPDGITAGTKKDEAEMDEWELERARREDRTSDGNLPTTTAPAPTTPATPVTPAPNVDGLPPDPSTDTGAAIDLPTPTQHNPAPPPAIVPATELAPSAPGYVTADLGLPSKAPMPETQYSRSLDSAPVKTVDANGAVEVHVNYADFEDYKGHHA